MIGDLSADDQRLPDPPDQQWAAYPKDEAEALEAVYDAALLFVVARDTSLLMGAVHDLESIRENRS